MISFLIDATIHTALLFGWSSITEIMKENEFFRQTGTEATDSPRLKRSDVSIKQVISRAENESCFVDNEEQGSQSEGAEISGRTAMFVQWSFDGTAMITY